MRTLAIIALVLALATPAEAQMACGARDAVVAKLGQVYGEVRRGGGLAGPTAMFELWVSEATGTWTILMTTPDGLSCVMVVGDGWQDAPPVVGTGA